ncbi:MAG: hypothetical protein V3R65_10400 [Acidiferrobacterales bacterium]
MTELPTKEQQIVQSHVKLIVSVVQACQNRDLIPQLEPILMTALENGWDNLVRVIRLILDGQRDPILLAGMDEEDGVIVDAILLGIQNPETLPDPNITSDPAAAAPGLAFMIHAADSGDTNTLQLIASMAEQMTHTRGDMSRLGKAVSRMVQGERNVDKLSEGMDTRGENLVLDILEELNKLRVH